MEIEEEEIGERATEGGMWEFWVFFTILLLWFKSDFVWIHFVAITALPRWTAMARDENKREESLWQVDVGTLSMAKDWREERNRPHSGIIPPYDSRIIGTKLAWMYSALAICLLVLLIAVLFAAPSCSVEDFKWSIAERHVGVITLTSRT